MQRCQVLIVGGGPAGSTCAERLKAAGMDVLVLDRRTFPRDKTCAGWVTPPVMDLLGIDSDEYAATRTLQPITGFRTGLIGSEPVESRYDRVVSYGIRRCEFDHFLLERSAAPTRLGEPLDSLERTGRGWVVNGDIEAELLIGAGGHFCPVARQLGTRDGRRLSVVTAQEVEFEVPADQAERLALDGATPELYFCNDLQGYGWCFRKGNFLNIGLGRLDAKQLSRHIAEFCEFLRESRHVRCEMPERFHGHAYVLYEHQRPRVVDERVLLIGDAAGLAYPHSGEGIRPAVESAVLAAAAVKNAKGDFSAERLAPYAKRLRERFGKPRSRGVSDWLPASWLRAVAARLMESRWFSRHVILDRWFLHANDAALTT